jgi:cbb3-type cytochrome oxidase subunit 3
VLDAVAQTLLLVGLAVALVGLVAYAYGRRHGR